jgi:hypothetical protein
MSEEQHNLNERFVLALERIADALERQASASVTAVQAEALSKADAAKVPRRGGGDHRPLCSTAASEAG